MKNLDSVFAAYMIGWAIFFVFYADGGKAHRRHCVRKSSD